MEMSKESEPEIGWKKEGNQLCWDLKIVHKNTTPILYLYRVRVRTDINTMGLCVNKARTS